MFIRFMVRQRLRKGVLSHCRTSIKYRFGSDFVAISVACPCHSVVKECFHKIWLILQNILAVSHRRVMICWLGWQSTEWPHLGIFHYFSSESGHNVRRVAYGLKKPISPLLVLKKEVNSTDWFESELYPRPRDSSLGALGQNFKVILNQIGIRRSNRVRAASPMTRLDQALKIW